MTGVLSGRYSLAQSGSILRACAGSVLRACFQDTLENRPVFSELIDRIMNDEIKFVFTTERTRLMRNEEIMMIFRLECKKHKVITYDETGSIDLNTPEDQFFSGIMDHYSVFEREKIKNRRTNSKLARERALRSKNT